MCVCVCVCVLRVTENGTIIVLLLSLMAIEYIPQLGAGVQSVGSVLWNQFTIYYKLDFHQLPCYNECSDVADHIVTL